jgi:hypothetical protein
MLSKRTIETHLKQDQMHLQSISSTNTDLIQFMQSSIDQTIKLLSRIHGGHMLLDTAQDVDGSHPEYPEGALLSFLKSLTYTYNCYYYPDHSDQQADDHSEDSKQPEHHQGDAVEAGKCCFSVKWLMLTDVRF